MIEALDHINLRTAQLDRMIDWYGRILQMHPGPRPDFGFPGAWLYAGDLALVHLVGVETPPPKATDLAMEHGAFRATGLRAFLDRLEAAGEPNKLVEVPGFPITQVNLWDPDGNHLHVDFDRAEMAD